MSNQTTATVTATALAAIDKLNRSLAKDSLDELVASKTKRSLLLVDVSDSMSITLRNGQRRIDALRKIVDGLRETNSFPIAAFGLRGQYSVDVVDYIPEPQGSTPLDLGIEFGGTQGATHLIVVTDGEPNSERAAFEAARTFGGPIDVFFVGDPHSRGAQFCAELAKMTGGQSGVADLAGKPRELESKIRLLLGDGSDAL